MRQCSETWEQEKAVSQFVPSSCRADQLCHILMLLPSHVSDPLVHYGRHFGRAVHAMCSIQALLTNGILHMGEEGEVVEESLTPE
jgi:hypothetical protein